MKLQGADFAAPSPVRENPSTAVLGVSLLLLVGLGGGAYWWMTRDPVKSAVLAWAKKQGSDGQGIKGDLKVRVEGSAGKPGSVFTGERGAIDVKEGDQIVTLLADGQGVVLLVRKSGEVVFVSD